MRSAGCSGSSGNAEANDGYEVVSIEKTKNRCSLCEEYSERHKSKPVVVMSCDGACLRGEVAQWQT